MPFRISLLILSFLFLSSSAAAAQRDTLIATEGDTVTKNFSGSVDGESTKIDKTVESTDKQSADDRDTSMLSGESGFENSTPSESTGEEDDGEEEEIELIEDFVVVDEKNEKEKWFSENYLRIDRTINLLTAKTLRKNALQFTVDHRTWEPVKEEPFHDFLGFDAGNLRITLGLRYGLFDRLDVGILRNNNGSDVFDTYEFDTRAQFLEQDTHYVDLAARAGLSWFSQKYADDALDVFAQLIINREFLYHFFIGTGLLFHNESSNDTKSNLDDHWSIAIPFSLDVRFLSWFSWNLEVVTSVAGYNERHPQMATSVKFITARHSFALVVTNSQYMVTADGVVTNTDRRFDELVVGFSVLKEFNL